MAGSADGWLASTACAPRKLDAPGRTGRGACRNSLLPTEGDGSAPRDPELCMLPPVYPCVQCGVFTASRVPRADCAPAISSPARSGSARSALGASVYVQRFVMAPAPDSLGEAVRRTPVLDLAVLSRTAISCLTRPYRAGPVRALSASSRLHRNTPSDGQ